MDAKINLVAPFFYVLRKWRILLIALLVGMIGTGIFCVYTYRGNKEKQVVNADELERIENEIVTAQRSCDQISKQIADTMALKEFREDYAANSIKMKIDWENVEESSTFFKLSGNKADEAAHICLAYLASHEFAEELNERLGTAVKAFFWQEIIQGEVIESEITVGTDGSQQVRMLLQVSVIFYDATECQHIMDTINSIMENRILEVSSSMNELDWERGETVFQTVSDVDLKNAQIAATNNANYSAKINSDNARASSQSQLEEMQGVLDQWTERKDALENGTVEDKISSIQIVDILVTIIIGTFGLFLFAICMIVATYILTDKVQDSEELARFTKQKILTFYIPEYQGKSKIDQWICQWERKLTSPISNEQFVKACVSVIQKQENPVGTNRITIMDAGYEQASGVHLMECLVNELKTKNDIRMIKDIKFGDEEFEDVLKSDIMIIAAYRGYDKKSSLAKKISLLNQYEISCLGIILL